MKAFLCAKNVKEIEKRVHKINHLLFAVYVQFKKNKEHFALFSVVKLEMVLSNEREHAEDAINAGVNV